MMQIHVLINELVITGLGDGLSPVAPFTNMD